MILFKYKESPNFMKPFNYLIFAYLMFIALISDSLWVNIMGVLINLVIFIFYVTDIQTKEISATEEHLIYRGLLIEIILNWCDISYISYHKENLILYFKNTRIPPLTIYDTDKFLLKTIDKNKNNLQLTLNTLESLKILKEGDIIENQSF